MAYSVGNGPQHKARDMKTMESRRKGTQYKPDKAWTYSYEDLMELTGLARNTVQKASSRGRQGSNGAFDPEDFRSVVLWIFRNASRTFRYSIIDNMGVIRSDKIRQSRPKQTRSS